MRGHWTAALRGECCKLLTLPMAWLAAGTILSCAVVLPILVAKSAEGQVASNADDVLRLSIGLLQVPFLLTGVMVVAQEYAPRQIRTALLTIPRRGVLLGAKSMVTAIFNTALAMCAVPLALLAARLGGASGTVATTTAVGAALYLLVVAALAFAVALCLRRMLASVATSVVLVVIAPNLPGIAEHARWLPTLAAQALYGDDSALGPGAGFAIASGWVIVVATLGVAGFLTRDA